jgi:hypothetical protein
MHGEDLDQHIYHAIFMVLRRVYPETTELQVREVILGLLDQGVINAEED